jgi:membrane protein YqaA with SNARE-associated domain
LKGIASLEFIATCCGASDKIWPLWIDFGPELRPVARHGPPLTNMGKYHLPIWLQAAVATSGGLGLGLLAFLDSTFLPFPSVNDLLLVDLCIQNPTRMPYYAFTSTLGSVLGCLVLYYIARKGEEAAFHVKAEANAPKIRRWVERNGFISLLVAALLPPPFPFKVFVLAAGALGMPVGTMLLSVTIARTVRFAGEGFLAVRYGNSAANYLMGHKTEFALGTLASILALYLVFWLVFQRSQQEE